MQFKISNYSWYFIHHLKKTTKSIETIILFLSTAFLHFEYDYSRGGHFANYFRIIKSLQSICTTTSTLFIKKGVQKLAAFNASTSSSSGACPSVWAASDQQTKHWTVCKTTNQMTPPSTTIFTEPQSQSLQSICSFDTNIDYSFRSSILTQWIWKFAWKIQLHTRQHNSPFGMKIEMATFPRLTLELHYHRLRLK